MSSVSHVAIISASITLTYVSVVVIYRLFFHPFAKYPGPFLAKISYLYAFYHAWIGDISVAQTLCHQKYGHIVRYNPDALMFDEPAANKEIHAPAKNFWKGKAYEPMKNDPHARPNIAFNLDKKDHARRKRIIVQAFSEHALRVQQPAVKSHIDSLCNIIGALPGEKWSQPTHIENLLYWCATDITTDLTFGRSYNLLTDKSLRKSADVILNALFRNHLVYQCPGLFKPGLNRWLDFGTWFIPSQISEMNEYLKLGVLTAMERLNSPPSDAPSRKDVLSYLISARDPETGTAIAQEDIVTEAAILLLAGGTTVGSALSQQLFYLSRTANRNALETLAAELRGTFASPDEIKLDTDAHKLDECVYLHACISESFRLLGAAAWWRDAGPGGATVTTPTATTFIPHGTPWSATNRDPGVFPDPYLFAPERWIPTSSFYADRGLDAKQWYAAAKAAYHPFGIGPRACIAKELGYLMMMLVTAQLVWAFDIRQGEGVEGETGGGGKPGMEVGRERKDEFQLYGSFTLKGEGPVVQFRRRGESE